MSKEKRLLVLTLFLSLAAQAQVAGDQPASGMDMQTQTGGFVKQLPPAPPETKGDVYLYSDWMMASIQLYENNTKLSRMPIRLDLQTNALEIQYQNQVRILHGNRIKAFTIESNKDGAAEEFVNGRNLKLNASPINGFFKVIDSAKWQLLVKSNLKLIPANYVAALDAGDRHDRLVKEDVYFFSKDSKLYQVYPSAKKFAAQFETDQELVVSLIKSEKINLKNQVDLVKLLNLMNERL